MSKVYTPLNYFWMFLALLFIGLKLAGIGVVASWSWWFVLMPIWIEFVLVGIFIFGVLIYYSIKRGRA